MDKSKEERERLEKYVCPLVDPHGRTPAGVLLSDEIKRYAHAFKMIDPFDPERLKPAGYELTVGDEYVLGGEKKTLWPGDKIRIPSFNVVVVMTAETVNLPRFVIARWNVRVKWAYEGLLWVGGPQVDPGWVGHLFCPLYNLSNRDVSLQHGEPIALMDFVTTTPFKPSESKPYARPPKRVLLEQYGVTELKSALYMERIDDIQSETREKISGLEQKVDSFATYILLILTVLFAVLGIFSTYDKLPKIPVLTWVSVALSVGALVFGLLAYLNSRRRR